MPIATITRKIQMLLIPLHSTDRLLIAFWCFLSLVSFVLQTRIPMWRGIVAANLGAALVTYAIAFAEAKTDWSILRWMHDWAAMPMVVFTYKQLYFMIDPIHQGRDYDGLLIAADRLLFRVNPTEWLAAFSNPVLTEVLQIAYSLFYVFFIAVGLELYLTRDIQYFRRFRFTIVYGFFISYVGYFFLPAAGPRFTLHDFSGIDTDLPGLIFTPALRWFINYWESIPSGVSNAAALASAQRDVFPSGHTMMTLVAIILAYKFKLRVRHYVLGMGLLLIFATVYLRYHYAVDVAAGAILVIPCLLMAGKLCAFLRSGTSCRNG